MSQGYSYARNEALIKAKTREFFGVGSVVTASTYLFYVIDFMLIGKILGQDAVAIAGLCDCFVDIAEFPGFALASGGPIAAGILLGRREDRKANGIFTLSLLLSMIGGIFCCLLIFFRDSFAAIMTDHGYLTSDTASYIGWTLARSPFAGVGMVLSAFAILDNHSSLAMAMVIASNTVNLVLDYVFMEHLGLGVSGAAAATLIGTIVGILIGSAYLLSERRTFKIAFSPEDFKGTGRMLSSSSASFGFDKASRIFAGLVINIVLFRLAGSIGIALYAVYGRLKFILRIIAGGALKTISSLGSLLYGERDFFGLARMLNYLLRNTYMMTATMIAILFLIPGTFLRSYGLSPEPMTVLAFRIMLISLPFFWMNDILAMLYASIQRQKLSVMLFALQNVVLRTTLLFICVGGFRIPGYPRLLATSIWCILVELMSMLIVIAFEKKKYGSIAILGPKAGNDDECHMFSLDGTKESVANVHEEIEYFCNRNMIAEKNGVFLAIAFEEVVLSIINHSPDIDVIDICLLREGDNLIVRIRDDGPLFDPLSHVDQDDILQRNGIRLLEKMIDRKSYTRIMNMNNTVLSIRLEDSHA